MQNVFRSRNFRLVFLGALVSELGAVLYSFAVGFYLLDISQNNAFLQGVYLAVCGVVVLLSTPLGGVLGDRINKAKIMVVCDYIRGGLILLATALMLIFPASGAHIVILFGAGIGGNIIGGIFSPAARAIFPHIVEEEQLQQANAYISIKSSLLGILGVMLAGVLYAALPITALFLTVGLCYIASGISEMFIRYEQPAREGRLTLRSALGDMGEGFRYIRAQKGIMALMGCILFVNFFISPVGGNFIPYFIKTDVAGAPSFLFDSFLTPELWSSVLSVAAGLSSLTGAALLSRRIQRDKVGRATALRLCVMAGIFLALTLGYWLLVDRGRSLNLFLILICGGYLMFGFLVAGINIPINTTLMRIVDRDKLSKVSSITSVTSQGLVPIASVLAGAILQLFGSTILLVFLTLGFTATALFMLLNKRVGEI